MLQALPLPQCGLRARVEEGNCNATCPKRVLSLPNQETRHRLPDAFFDIAGCMHNVRFPLGIRKHRSGYLQESDDL